MLVSEASDFIQGSYPPPEQKSLENQMEAALAFSDLAFAVSYLHFCHTLLVKELTGLPRRGNWISTFDVGGGRLH